MYFIDAQGVSLDKPICLIFPLEQNPQVFPKSHENFPPIAQLHQENSLVYQRNWHFALANAIGIDLYSRSLV
jgi:hypothetical protein